jgi:hypothetical protein
MFDWRDYPLGKARYRGGSGSRLHHISGLTREEALHWLAHDKHGRAFARERGEPLDVLADHLVEASMRPTNKHEAPKMDINKTLREVGEAGFTKMIERYAKTVYPELSTPRAFAKVFEEDSAEGRAIRRCWQTSKQGATAEPSNEDEDGDDALDELEQLAAEERKRNPGMSKAVAFSKVYTDPANASLASRERKQNRPRA